MGHRASSTVTLAFDGAVVPRANLLGAPGEGLPILLASLNKSRPSIAAHAIGIGHAAFADETDYARERVQSGKRVIDFQGNQFTIADLASELAMVERWHNYVANLIDEGVDHVGEEVGGYALPQPLADVLDERGIAGLQRVRLCCLVDGAQQLVCIPQVQPPEICAGCGRLDVRVLRIIEVKTHV